MCLRPVARPFHVNDLERFLNEATWRSLSTVRPRETWKTCTVTGCLMLRTKLSFTLRPRVTAFADAERKPTEAAHAVVRAALRWAPVGAMPGVGPTPDGSRYRYCCTPRPYEAATTSSASPGLVERLKTG